MTLPGPVGREAETPARKRRQEMGISQKSWPGTVHGEANCVFRRRCWRFLGGGGWGWSSKVPEQSRTWRGDEAARTKEGTPLRADFRQVKKEGLRRLRVRAGQTRAGRQGAGGPGSGLPAAWPRATDQMLPSLSRPVWKMGQRCLPRGASLITK